MKKITILFASAVFIMLSSFCTADKWTKHTSRNGHFSIDFPCVPGEATRTDSTDADAPLAIHYITCFPNDSTGYMVDWVDLSRNYPKDKTLKQLLEESRDAATHTIRAASVITTTTNLGKDPYIEFAFTSSEYAGRGRVYIINKFQYVVITLFPLTTGISPDADKFIKSFRHI